MNIENFHRVLTLHASLRELEHDRITAKIGITLNGRYQDDDLIADVKPHVHAVLDQRIAAVKEELISLGVSM